MRLQITYAGRWYFGLTALLGGVCAISSNNVIYLIESILLAAMIVSVFAAYRAVGRLSIEYRRHPAICESPSMDQIRVLNRSKVSRFCLEVGEWRRGRFTPLVQVARVPANGIATVPSRRVYHRRGRYDWDGLAVACCYPFGLFRIIRVSPAKGQRIVWPSRAAASGKGSGDSGLLSSQRAGISIVEGEIRTMAPDDDWRSVVWTLSARGGEPVVRVRGAEQEDPAVVIDLRGVQPGPELERRISAAATTFYSTQTSGGPPDASRGGTLVLIDEGGKHRFQGTGAALDRLALIGEESERQKEAA